uniref:Ribonuclease H-like domain-containing protein n=1 Tax=Tanacetum cinerariifolium TaxID=118510 RepID=A0A6L2KF65_TANCI|nr:ribonuclease H-like domain-containing protein [Tanacetum cinerariifolium]
MSLLMKPSFPMAPPYPNPLRFETNRPTERLNLHVSSVSPLPKSCREAFNDVNWHSAMRDEYNALIKNSTWILVPRPSDVNVVRCLWLFRHKYLADGTLSRYKARLVANGSTQLEGVDVDETFSPVVKPGTIRTVLSLATSRHWPVHQHSLYGLKQALRAWFQRFAAYITRVCLHMHDPREPHFSALKRILRYVCGTLDYGLQLFSSSTTDLVASSDADWVGCPTTRRSTSGYYVFLGNNILSWSAKRQPTLFRSSAEAEYRGVANARTKHIEIDIHFVRDLVATGQVRVLHVPSRYQFADIFTKGLPTALFEEFRSNLSAHRSESRNWSPDDELNALSKEKEDLVNAHRKHVEDTMDIVRVIHWFSIFNSFMMVIFLTGWCQ